MIVLTETLKYFIQRYFSIEIDKYQFQCLIYFSIEIDKYQFQCLIYTKWYKLGLNL